MRRSIRTGRAKCWPAAGSTESVGAAAVPQKSNQGRVDLVGTFLLNPMPGAVDDELLLEVGQNPFHIGDPPGTDQAGDNGIVRPGNEQGRLTDLRVLPRCGQFPVAIEVAVPAQSAAEARLAVGFAEGGKIGLGQPVRQRPVRTGFAEESLAVLDEQGGRRIGKSAAEQGPHRQIDVALELALGDTGRLKVLPIEIGDTALAQGFERSAAAPERRGNAQTGNGGENIGAEHRRVPGNRCAPIMADDNGPLFSKCGNQRHHIADMIEDAVGGDVRRRAGPAEPAHIRCDDMVARRGNCGDLMPPGIG